MRRHTPALSCCTGYGRNTRRGWPENCQRRQAPWVPRQVIERCATSCRAGTWSSMNTARMAPARGSTRRSISACRAQLYDRVSVPRGFLATGADRAALAERDRARVSRRQSMAQAGHDLDHLPQRESARHQRVLRPRSCAEELRRQRGSKAALPGAHDRRAAARAAMNAAAPRSGRSASRDRCWHRDRSSAGRPDS